LRFPNSLLPIAPATFHINQSSHPPKTQLPTKPTSKQLPLINLNTNHHTHNRHHVPRRRHRFSHHPQHPSLLSGKPLSEAIIGFPKDVGGLDCFALHTNHIANPLHPQTTRQFEGKGVAGAAVKGIEKAGEMAQKVKEATGLGTGAAKGDANDLAGQASGKANELAGKAQGKAAELEGKAKGTIEETKGKSQL
jgi:hypothetical protein